MVAVVLLSARVLTSKLEASLSSVFEKIPELSASSKNTRYLSANLSSIVATSTSTELSAPFAL
jgi:hypothetical protein